MFRTSWLVLSLLATASRAQEQGTAAANGLSTNSSSSAMDCPSWSNRFQQHLDGVCVCTTDQCHMTSHKQFKVVAGHANAFETSKSGKRFAHQLVPLQTLSDTNTSTASVDLIVDLQTSYQSIIGFGGSFTDSTAINVYKMKPQLQQLLLDAYFSDNGLQYSLGRVPIASTDFSEYVYSYNPVEDDLDMNHFSIDVDRAPKSHKLDLIHRALNGSSREIKLFASSWAPPAWMSRENRTENCTLTGQPGDKYWKALALYYSKFFDAYDKEEGIKFWGMTTQNEPEFQPMQSLYWQSLKFNYSIEGEFIKKDLGPLLKEKHPDIKLIMMDDMKDLIAKRQVMLQDPEVKQYVSGLGVHWYWNWDFLHKGDFDALTAFHNNHSDLFIIGTEACEGFLPKGMGTGVGVRIQEPDIVWQRGENYARDIINDLANYVSAWTDWNLVLNTGGGPNWVNNVVDAPIIVDEQGGEEFYLQPMYYVLGHVSKFLVPGSVRISLENDKQIADSINSSLSSVDRVAFKTPTNEIVLILNNRNDKNVTLNVLIKNQQKSKVSSSSLRIELAPRSVQTLVVPSDQQEQEAQGGESTRPTPSASTVMVMSGAWWVVMGVAALFSWQ